MDFFSIDQDKCVGCGLCERACLRDLINMGADNVPVLDPENAKRCIVCGHCAVVCPMGAVSLKAPGGARAPCANRSR